jgi:hypothetical protein
MSEPGNASEVLRARAREAAFVFTGRIQALGESNLDGVEPEDRMATVEVEEVALAPRDLGDLRGRTLTIYLETAEGIEPGQHATFFAQSWHYGKNIGVIEVGGAREFGRTSLRATDLKEEVIAERLRTFEEQIEERIRGCEAILSARVMNTTKVEVTEGLPGLDEGVEWWTAELWIASIEKGRPPEDRRIWFPEGGDRDWGPVPKAYPGQTGIWLLRPVMEVAEDDTDQQEQQPQSSASEPTQVRRLMAIDPLDYHALSDLPRVQTLLWRLSEG